MKKILLIVLLTVSAFSLSRASVFLTNDPINTGATVAGFCQNAEDAIMSTTNLLSLLGTSQQQLQNIERTVGYVEKAKLGVEGLMNMYRMIQDIESIVRQVGKSVLVLKDACSQKITTVEEAQHILNSYTGVITSLTDIGSTILSITTAGAQEMTQTERRQEMKGICSDLWKTRQNLERFNTDLEKRLNWRNYINKTTTGEKVASVESFSAVLSELVYTVDLRNPIGEIPYTTGRVMGDISEYLGLVVAAAENKPKPTPTYTASEAKRLISQQALGMRGLFYILSAIVGLIGAVQVYKKFSQGSDELSKSIAIWSGTTLLLFICGILFEHLFK